MCRILSQAYACSGLLPPMGAYLMGQGDTDLCAMQVARQLQKVKSEIVASEAAGSGHATLLLDKERQKKWMKF